jgi:hypothetical protein
VNLVPLAAGIIIAIGGVSWHITKDFTLSGIAFGTIVAVAGWHLARVLAPKEMQVRAEGRGRRGRRRVGHRRRTGCLRGADPYRER